VQLTFAIKPIGEWMTQKEEAIADADARAPLKSTGGNVDASVRPDAKEVALRAENAAVAARKKAAANRAIRDNAAAVIGRAAHLPVDVSMKLK
jgi:hypothetical protein